MNDAIPGVIYEFGHVEQGENASACTSGLERGTTSRLARPGDSSHNGGDSSHKLEMPLEAELAKLKLIAAPGRCADASAGRRLSARDSSTLRGERYAEEAWASASHLAGRASPLTPNASHLADSASHFARPASVLAPPASAPKAGASALI